MTSDPSILADYHEFMKQRINDIEVAFSESGRSLGQGAKVVMLHGLAEDRHSFAGARQRLQEFHAFACDLRGHGETSLGNAEGTLAQLGDDLVGFLETVTGPAKCIGYSLGGAIVLWAAAMRPDLVLSAIVTGTSTKVGRAAAGFFRERIELLENDRAAFAEALHQDTAAQIVNREINVRDVTRNRLQAIGAGGGYINAAKAMLRLHEQPITPLLEKIQCPVDVIGADKDAFCPRKAADMITEAIDDAVYHEIANAGHLMSVDQPVSYNNTLQKILTRRTI